MCDRDKRDKNGNALVRGVGERTVPTDLDLVVGLRESNTNGQESGGDSRETHLELEFGRRVKERAEVQDKLA